MIDFKVIGFALLILACSLTFAGTAKYKDNYYNNIINHEKAEGAFQLAEANQKTLEIERRYQEISQSLELEHVENKKHLDQVYADNKRLARELGGLRDPGKSENCAGNLPSTSESPSISVKEFESARLSEAATEFLLTLVREADQTASERNLCQDWIIESSKIKG